MPKRKLFNYKIKAMKISVLCISFFFLFTIKINAQYIIKGRIVDANTKAGLMYVNIMVLNHPTGTTSDEHGYFSFRVPKFLANDTLVISHVAYKTQKIPINRINNSMIELYPQAYKLDEIVISPNNVNNNEIIVNKFKKRKTLLLYSRKPFNFNGNLFIPYRPAEPTIETIYIANDKKYDKKYKIKEVWLYFRSFNRNPVKVRLRIFSCKNDSPHKDLLKQTLIFQVNQNNYLAKVNIEKFNIYFPENGLFIGSETLIIPENKSIIPNQQGDTAIVYSPFLYKLPSKNIGDYWFYSKGKWTKSGYWYWQNDIWYMTENKKKKKEKDEIMSKYYLLKPAISIVLTN